MPTAKSGNLVSLTVNSNAVVSLSGISPVPTLNGTGTTRTFTVPIITAANQTLIITVDGTNTNLTITPTRRRVRINGAWTPSYKVVGPYSSAADVSLTLTSTSVSYSGAAAMSGAGTLTTATAGNGSGTVSITGSGTVAATGKPTILGSDTLSGSGSISTSSSYTIGSGTALYPASSTYPSSSTYPGGGSGSSGSSYSGSLTLSGGSSLSASGSVGGAVTHGYQINSANTGHTAYYDSSLSRNVADSDLIVHTGLVSVSDFVGNGGTLTKRWFKGGLIIDRDNVTMTACKFDGGVNGFYSGVHHPFTLNWCTIDTPGAAGDDSIHFQDYTAYRCRLGGNSDGAKINGNCTITECFIRVELQSADDHNDGLQAVGSYAGSTIVRCNIDARPTGGTGQGNAAIFVADSSTGLQTWTDNFLAGGQYGVCCYENATYNVQGNWFLQGSFANGPAARAVIPQSNLTWGTTKPNLLVTSGGAQVSVVAAP